jgi:hypothetical protein
MNFLLSGFYFFCLYMLPPGIEGTSNPVPYTGIKPAVYDSIPSIRVNYKIITNTDHSYGYDVFINGILRIHQPVIPGMPGKRGFPRRGDAKKVACLAIKKVRNGFMPPTIAKRELDSLRIKF